MNRNDLARAAFYGNLPELASALLDAHGYTLDGVHYPANGASLAEFIHWMDELPGPTCKRCDDRGFRLYRTPWFSQYYDYCTCEIGWHLKTEGD